MSARGQVGQAGAVPVVVLEYRVGDGGEVWVAGGGQPVDELGHHELGGAAEQADERDLSCAVGDHRGWFPPQPPAPPRPDTAPR